MSPPAPEDPNDMIDRLQRQQSSSTERIVRPRSAPQHPWVCGYAELGQSCASGPTKQGLCGRCAHSSTTSRADNPLTDSSSDAREDLPLCIPRRTGAWQRQSLRINLAILTAGIMLLCMLLPSREQNFVPGELSAGHAQIMATTLVSQRCGLCHPASHQASDSAGNTEVDQSFWIGVLNDTAQRMIANDGRQDALCMQCHKTHMPRAADRNPHDLSIDQWRERLTARQSTPVGQLVVRSHVRDEDPMPESIATKTSCATCHNEHHGRGFDIKLIADDRCQACHARRFESLAAGHPEFVNFPAARDRGLAFSHVAHADKHFPKKNREFDCRSCHLDSERLTPLGGVTRSVSFEKACASCHAEPIRAAVAGGWAVLELPSIDSKAAKTHPELDQWPELARFGFEGHVSPVLRALLAGDEQLADAINKIPSSGSLKEVPTINGEREQLTIAVAEGIRRLMRDTADLGQAAWQTRLQRVTQARLRRELNGGDRALIAAMCRGVSPDLFRRAEQEWFRDQTQLVDMSTNLQSTESMARNGRTSPAHSTTVSPPSGKLVNKLEVPPKTTLPPSDGGDDLLSAEHTSGDSLVDPLSSDHLLTEALPKNPEAALQNSTPPSKPGLRPTIKGATHVAAGGWYLDEQTLAVRYMTTGHADETLAAWCYWWSMMENTPGDRMFATSTGSGANSGGIAGSRDGIAASLPGGCAECHLLNKSPTNSERSAETSEPAFSLSALYRTASRSVVKEFTKFSHAPHLQLPAVNDCRYCHKILPTDAATTTYAAAPSVSSRVHPHGSEFAGMNVQQCTACHRPGGANDRCTQCHNYHVTR